MAENFNLIWGSNASQSTTWSDSDYQRGWETVGDTPPTAQQFDALQRRNDLKSQALNNIITPIAEATDANNRKPQTAYNVGDMQYDSQLPTGWYLLCTVGGTSGDGDITFPTPLAEDASVMDGTVVWRLHKLSTSVANIDSIEKSLAESTGYGIVSGCEPTISGLTVTVGAGVVHLSDGTRKEIASTNITLDPADDTNPRIDLVYITSAGEVAKITGTAAASPSAPTLPNSAIQICTVTVAANATTGTINRVQTIAPNLANYGVVNVKDFGAKGDGSTDDTAAIQDALNVGGNIIFPTGVYKLETPVHSDNNSTNLIGLDAVIDCRGQNAGVSGYQSRGSGLLIRGNSTKISGFKFIGYEVEYNSDDYKYGRLLGIDADNVIVENNQFENGNGGAVYVWQHSEISIINNAFNNCNNHPDGYYGAIHITGASDVYIKDNRIKNHWSSGISIMGSNAKNINITNNTIIAKDNLSSDTSMGIYCLNGASKNIYINANVIKNATAECIVIHTLTTAQADNIIIENNFLSNAGYCALSIQSHDAATTYNSVIKGNTIYQPGNGHGIRCENLEDSIISSNYVYTDSTADYVNVGVYVDSKKCIITNNYIKGYQDGLYIYARDNDSIDSNYIYNCGSGIGLTRAVNGASIINNVINKCSVKGIVVANSSGVRVANNKVTECTVPGEGFGSSYSQITTGASKTLDYAQGTLSAGSATINFYGIKDNDYLLALPLTGGAGTLRITNKNVTNNQVAVSSSDATDTRKFVVLKIASLFF